MAKKASALWICIFPSLDTYSSLQWFTTPWAQRVVGVHGRALRDVLGDRLAQRLGAHVGDMADAHLAAALHQRKGSVLLRLWLALVDVLLFATHKRLVTLDCLALAANGLGADIAHGLTDAVHHEHCCAMTKVLYVEDNEDNVHVLRNRLTRKGFTVLTASDGAQGVSMAEKQPEIILMDLSLPVLDGWEATRRIKAGEGTRHIPVIALTAHAMTGDREKALAAGCDEFDTKPVEIDRLIEKIQTLVGKGQPS